MILNKAYLYKDTLYVLIKSTHYKNHKKYFRCIKIKSDGLLGKEFIVRAIKNNFKNVPKAKIQISVDLPAIDLQKIRYRNVIDSALQFVSTYKKCNKRSIEAKRLQVEIAKLAYGVCSIYNTAEGRNYNLRDFAKSIKLKRSTTLYGWVYNYLLTQFTSVKYSALKRVSDTTLVSVINNYQKFYSSIIGFSTRLDSLIQHDINCYTKEIYSRQVSS